MSAKNKLENKANRRDERDARPCSERRPLGISGVSAESAPGLLCDPGVKLGASARRYFKRARYNEVVMPAPVVRPFAVKLAEKLARLPLQRVLRRRSQFAARAAGAKYKMESLSPNSRFRPAIQKYQDANIFAMKQAQAELDARRLHATNQLAGN